MQAIFNELSITSENIDEIDNAMNIFIQTCKYAVQANSESDFSFNLRFKENIYNNFIKDWMIRKNFNDEVLFLSELSKTPDWAEDVEIFEDKFEQEMLFNKLTITADNSIGLAAIMKGTTPLIISLNINNLWNISEIKLKANKETLILKNANNQEHIYEHLEFFPEWNNVNFYTWKPKLKEIDKLLPLPKLSDLVWLKFIDKFEIWENKRERNKIWLDFVKKLGEFTTGGEREDKIIKIFEKIAKINGFEKVNICPKPKRMIYCFKGREKYYLTPDKQHGAFEVWNSSQEHEGEWHFYGEKNTSKKAESRNICN